MVQRGHAGLLAAFIDAGNVTGREQVAESVVSRAETA
jgi:hypothetical protein